MEPIYTLTQTTSFDTFKTLNHHLENKILGKSKKRTKFLGLMQMALAAIYLAVVVIAKQKVQTFTLVLAVIILLLGLFNVVYYPVFFKKKMEHAVQSTYQNYPYLQEPVIYDFFDDHFVEITSEKQAQFSYHIFEQVQEDENHYYLLSKQTGIHLDKAKLGEHGPALISHIKEKATLN